MFTKLFLLNLFICLSMGASLNNKRATFVNNNMGPGDHVNNNGGSGGSGLSFNPLNWSSSGQTITNNNFGTDGNFVNNNGVPTGSNNNNLNLPTGFSGFGQNTEFPFTFNRAPSNQQNITSGH